jgi:hypothetical protein
VDGFTHITQFNCSVNESYPPEMIDTQKIYSILDGTALRFRIDKDSILSFPLKEKFDALLMYSENRDSARASEIKNSNTLKVINALSQRIDIPADSMMLFYDGKKIVFSTIEFVQIDTTFRLQRAEGYLLD